MEYDARGLKHFIIKMLTNKRKFMDDIHIKKNIETQIKNNKIKISNSLK